MNSMVKAENKKYQCLDRCVFALGLAAYTVLLFTLFCRQTLGNVNFYHSDMKAYILEMQGLDSGYSFSLDKVPTPYC